MTAKVIENERTAMAQKITRQPDGPGKRIGKKGEISFIGKLVPGAAKLFRERLPQIQAEAARLDGLRVDSFPGRASASRTCRQGATGWPVTAGHIETVRRGSQHDIRSNIGPSRATPNGTHHARAYHDDAPT